MGLSPPRNRHLGGGSAAADLPLADISTNLRDIKLGDSPSKGGAYKAGARYVAASRKDRDDSGILSVSDLKTGVTKDWRGPDKFQKTKSATSISRGDRYIPNRELKKSTGPGGHSLVDEEANDTVRSQSSSDGMDSNIIAANIAAANAIPTDLEGGQTLEEAAHAERGQRILSFSAACPGTPAGPDVRSRYAAAKPKSTLPSSLNSAGRRKIPTNPERTLDAPNMVDDYYYNLLDWSSTNIVAIALQTGVWLWNGNTGDASQLLDTTTQSERVGGNGLVTGLRWDADGNILSVGLEGGYTQIWDVESASRLRTLKPSAEGGADNAAVNVMAWAPDGTLNAGFQSGIIKEFDVRERDALTRTLEKAHSGPVCGIEWRSDSALMATGGNDNVVKVWDRRTSVPKMRKENHQAAVKALAWCPHNLSMLATGGGTSDRKIHVWNTTQNSRTLTIQTSGQITSLKWSQHYRELVSTHGIGTHESAKGMINIWSHPSGQKVAEIEAHEQRVLHASLSPDGEVLATVSDDEELKLWRVFEKPVEASKGAKGPGGALSTKSGNMSNVRTLR
nr:putative wd repeat-containing protein slp1 [Thecaphora frezii]